MDISGPQTTAQQLPSQDCDLVTVPARQGLEAVDILRLRDGIGPVLHDGACGTLGFLVPPGTAEGWDLPGSACTAPLAGGGARRGVPGAVGGVATTGARVVRGPAGASSVVGCTGHAKGAEAGRQPVDPEAHDTGWLVPPDAAYATATDPADLRAALGEAARTLEAADRCQ